MSNHSVTTTRGLLVFLTLLALAVTPVLADYDAGLSYFRAGKYVESAAEWEAVVANAPEYHFGYYMLGNCYLKLKKYRDADPQFRKAIDLEPGKFEYHANLAQTLMIIKKYDEVIIVLDQAEPLASTPAHKAHLRKMRGLSLVQVKDFGRAEQDLKQCNPAKDHQVASALARSCYSLREYGCLKKATQQSMALKSQDYRTLSLFVNFAIDSALRTKDKAKKLSFYRDAEPQAAKLTKIAKNRVKAFSLYGAAQLGTKKYPQAITTFKKVLQLDAKHCNAMLNIGTANTELKKWKELIIWSKKAAKCDPKNSFGPAQQALAYNKLEDWDNAIASANVAVGLKASKYNKGLLDVANKGLAARKQHAAVEADAVRVAKEKAAEEAKRAAELKRLEDYKAATGTGDGG